MKGDSQGWKVKLKEYVQGCKCYIYISSYTCLKNLGKAEIFEVPYSNSKFYGWMSNHFKTIPFESNLRLNLVLYAAIEENPLEW